MFHIFYIEVNMIEYDKLINVEYERNFLTYLFAKNGLLALFTDNYWDSEQYDLRYDLDVLFLADDSTTYKGVPLNQLSSNVKTELILWCKMAYTQLETYYTKLHNLGKTDDEIVAIAAQIDKSNFIGEIARGIKECTIHEKLNEVENDFTK